MGMQSHMSDVPNPVARAWNRLGRWRRPLKYASWAVGGLVGAAVLFFGILYATTSIPNPHAEAVAQAAIINYRDGSRLGVVGDVNRVDVRLSDVPPAVRRAVLAAEDRGFYSEAGVSLRDTLRAAWVDITGGHLQGGSTITQQYVRNAYLSQHRTIWRKMQEVVIALKVWQQRTKSEVLQDYLNTVYFGRGAYGIQAASRAYFGKPVSALDAAQGAVLAGLIRGPSIYDPAKNPQLAHQRWRYVVDGMAKEGWLTPHERATITYPEVLPPHRNGSFAGTNGYVVQSVLTDLRKHGFSDRQIDRSGLRITTTIDPRMQQAAVHAEYSVLKNAPKDPVSGLAAVVPGDGAIRAMYGGRDYTSKAPTAQLNKATQIKRQPGSSFKPYVLATALEHGISLYRTFDGTSPKRVPGYTTLVHNFANEQCYSCTLLRATALSVNTVYVPLAKKVGPDKVAHLAHAAGIPKSVKLTGPSGRTTAAIALGVYEVSPMDQAVGFSTFASGGVRADPYIVAEVHDRTGHLIYRHRVKKHRTMPKDVAADVTFALQKVIAYGTAASEAKLAGGRPAAGKTGTTENESDAWFVGYTPQLSAAVWMGYPQRSKKLHGVEGIARVTGGTLPARVWRLFMDDAMKGQPVKQFPAYQRLVAVPPPASPGGAPAATAPTTTNPPTTRATTQAPTQTATPSAPVPTTPAPTPPPTTSSPPPKPTTSSPPPPSSSSPPGASSPTPSSSTSFSSSPAPAASGAPG